MRKRLFNITASTTTLVALSPVYTIIAYKVKESLGSAVASAISSNALILGQ